MRFEWDPQKDRINRAKHGVRFEMAQFIFFDAFVKDLDRQLVDGEERWMSIGRLANGQLLVVVYTHHEDDQGEVFRLISARKAMSHERRRYEEDP